MKLRSGKSLGAAALAVLFALAAAGAAPADEVKDLSPAELDALLAVKQDSRPGIP